MSDDDFIGPPRPCPACTAAAADWTHGGCFAACPGCRLRELAKGHTHWLATKHRKVFPDYEAILRAEFGDDWLAGYERVDAEHQRIRTIARAVLKRRIEAKLGRAREALQR